MKVASNLTFFCPCKFSLLFHITFDILVEVNGMSFVIVISLCGIFDISFGDGLITQAIFMGGVALSRDNSLLADHSMMPKQPKRLGCPSQLSAYRQLRNCSTPIKWSGDSKVDDRPRPHELLTLKLDCEPI